MRLRDPIHPIGLLAVPPFLAAVIGGPDRLGVSGGLVLMLLGTGVVAIARALVVLSRGGLDSRAKKVPWNEPRISGIQGIQSGATTDSAGCGDTHDASGKSLKGAPNRREGWTLEEILRREG